MTFEMKNWEGEEVKSAALCISYNMFLCHGYNYSQNAISPLSTTVTFLVLDSEHNLWRGMSASYQAAASIPALYDLEPKHNTDDQWSPT